MMNNLVSKEKIFLGELESMFTGAAVDGASGFINLMRIKNAYFQSIRDDLIKQINARAKPGTDFREELFDKLYTFFHRYFCESGSIYFRNLPAFAKTYERVYADGEDIALSWKTQQLYYVKSDQLICSMPVRLAASEYPNSPRFYFDAAELAHKQNNERREFVYTLSAVTHDAQGAIINLKVSHSKQGGRTKTDDITKRVRQEGVQLHQAQLQKACQVFAGQTEVDFFIHKNAKQFLREQFDLWFYQYMFREANEFSQARITQLQAIKQTAYEIIDFIAQFEDELRRVWEKPKFVRNVNYVVTLERLPVATRRKIAKHKGAQAQIREWQELGIANADFLMHEIIDAQSSQGKRKTPKACQFLPLDTKHFKDLELEILNQLGDLDEAVDGEFVHSENWQALNSLRARYQAKIQCIYIDPPFNLGGSDRFAYRTNYKDSSWATLLENRIALARDFLREDGSMFVRCDYNGNWIVRCLMDSVFGENNFRNEIIVGKSNRIKTKGNKYLSWYDNVFYYAKKNELLFFNHLTKTRDQLEWRSMDKPGDVYKKIPLEYVSKLSKENIVYDSGGNPTSRARIFLGKEVLPKKGRRYPSQEKIIEMEKAGLN